MGEIHLRDIHCQAFCNICVQAKSSFVSRQQGLSGFWRGALWECVAKDVNQIRVMSVPCVMCTVSCVMCTVLTKEKLKWPF